MKSFEIVASGVSMGVWTAETAEAALDMYAKDAGYESFADACKVASGENVEAVDVTAIESVKAEIKAWAATDRANGVRPNADGSLPEITAEVLGRRVNELGLDEVAADALKVELMGIWTAAVK